MALVYTILANLILISPLFVATSLVYYCSPHTLEDLLNRLNQDEEDENPTRVNNPLYGDVMRLLTFLLFYYATVYIYFRITDYAANYLLLQANVVVNVSLVIENIGPSEVIYRQRR